MKIPALVILVLSGAVLYRLYLWLIEAARTPDPWGPEIAKEMEEPDAVPVCSHCLTPQEHNGWFCPQCGSTVGPFSNYLPFVYPFSIGDALRRGMEAGLEYRGLVKTGYVLVAVAMLPMVTIVVPFYLFFLCWHYLRRRQPAQLERH